MSDIRTGFTPADDGLQLYWRTLGHGPVMVFCNGVGVSTFFWKHIAQHFRHTHRIIMWDYRGHGRSGVPADIPSADLSIPRCARDMFTVLDALGVQEPALLLGHSMGCQVILEAYHQQPERVRALALMFGTYGRPLDTFMNFKGSGAVIRRLAQTAKQTSRAQRRLLQPLYASPFAYDLGRVSRVVSPERAERTDVERYLEHLSHMDVRLFMRMVEQMGDHDLAALLPQVRVPSLVFGAEHDLFTPLEAAKTMAREIPDAELEIVPRGSHAAVVEHAEQINARLERFLAEHDLLTPAPRVGA